MGRLPASTSTTTVLATTARRPWRRASTLKGNGTLTSLDLDWNDIGQDGGLALAEALQSNTTLKELHLGANSLDDDTKQRLRDAVSGREGFELDM